MMQSILTGTEDPHRALRLNGINADLFRKGIKNAKGASSTCETAFRVLAIEFRPQESRVDRLCRSLRSGTAVLQRRNSSQRWKTGIRRGSRLTQVSNHVSPPGRPNDRERVRSVYVPDSFAKVVSGLPVWIDVKNQARVHSWLRPGSSTRLIRIPEQQKPWGAFRRRRQPLAPARPRQLGALHRTRIFRLA